MRHHTQNKSANRVGTANDPLRHCSYRILLTMINTIAMLFIMMIGTSGQLLLARHLYKAVAPVDTYDDKCNEVLCISISIIGVSLLLSMMVLMLLNMAYLHSILN